MTTARCGPAALARRLHADEGGQVVVLLSLVMSTLLLAVGLAIDSGALFVVRRTAQSAADAAAWAGAVELYRGSGAASARDAAVAEAGLNGFAAGPTVTITVSSPPLGGAFAGNASFVEVVIVEEVATSFLPGAANGRTRVSARAVAGTSPVASGHAILALSPDEQQAFKVSGNGDLTTLNGGIMVNSDRNQAAQKSGNGVITSPYLRTVGQVQCSGANCPVPNTTTGASPAADPFASVPPPSTAGLPIFTNTDISDNGTHTLEPGIYVFGIKVSGNGAVNFKPGTYILQGGGLQVSGNAALRMDAAALPTEGLLLFNTHDNFPGPPGVCKKIQVSGNGTVALRGQSTGTHAGLFIYQDRSCSIGVQWSGNGEVTALSGTIYAPAADVQISGNGTAALTVGAQIVSRTVHISGNANITIEWDPNRAASPLLPALVE